jgi:hypothetical protein
MLFIAGFLVRQGSVKLSSSALRVNRRIRSGVFKYGILSPQSRKGREGAQRKFPKNMEYAALRRKNPSFRCVSLAPTPPAP